MCAGDKRADPTRGVTAGRHNDRMLTVPAEVWRGGSVRRAVTIGVPTGLFFGALAWLDSGFVLAGAVVVVILGVGYGSWMARRMARYWPGAVELTGAERVTVVTMVRRGNPVVDPALAPAVLDYGTGLHAAAERGRPWRWLIVVVLLIVAVMALRDAVLGSWGNALASLIYLVLVGLEMSWWPIRRTELLTNGDRAAVTARQIAVGD